MCNASLLQSPSFFTRINKTAEGCNYVLFINEPRLNFFENSLRGEAVLKVMSSDYMTSKYKETQNAYVLDIQIYEMSLYFGDDMRR